MLNKELLDRTTTLIRALMLGYELPYEDTIIALDKNLNTIRQVEIERDGLLLDSWIPMIFETGIAFFTSIAKRLSDEDYKKVFDFVEKQNLVLE